MSSTGSGKATRPLAVGRVGRSGIRAGRRIPFGSGPRLRLRRRRSERPGRIWRLLALAAALACAAAVVGAVSYARSMQPSLRALPSIVRVRLAREHSTWVPFDKIPTMLVNATVATEDRSFWTNPGISFEGIVRAALVDLEHGAFLEGASTLQQQIVRDVFLSPRKTISRKVRGTILAVTLTRDFPRKTIFALYVNEVYYGNGAYGLAKAAESYFGTSPERLTPAQSTLLAGLPQAPSYLDPRRNPVAAKARQTIVLESMVAAGYLTPRQARTILHAPWDLTPPKAA